MTNITVTFCELPASRTVNYWLGTRPLVSIHQCIQVDGMWGETVIEIRPQSGPAELARETAQALAQAIQTAELWDFTHAHKTKMWADHQMRGNDENTQNHNVCR